MAFENKCHFIGRLVEDPELRQTKGGKDVCEVRFAVNSGYKDKKETVFITLVLWTGQAVALSEYKNKGDLLGVSARLIQQTYEKDGQNVTIDKYIVEDLWLPPKKESDEARGQRAVQRSADRSNPHDDKYDPPGSVF